MDNPTKPSLELRTHGACQSKKCLLVNPDLIESDKGTSKIQGLAQGAKIQKPHSFSDNRKGQLGRHIATALGTILRTPNTLSENKIDYREVQVAFDDTNKEIWVSTNTKVGNKALKEMTRSDVNYSVGSLVKSISANTLKIDETTVRESRHISKLQKLGQHRYSEFSEYKIKIIEPTIEPTTFKDGDHAERILADHFAMKGSYASLITGIKRPCAHCASYLRSKGYTVHTVGPMWFSHAASRGREIAPAVDQTSVTRNQAGELTSDHNTDSDTDTEGYVIENNSLNTSNSQKGAGLIRPREPDDMRSLRSQP